MAEPDTSASLAQIMPALNVNKIQRVLIIKLSAMGDILHALPVSAALSNSFPNMEISWVCENMFAPLLVDNPCLKELITLPKLNLKALKTSEYRMQYFGKLREIRSKVFDLVIDLQGLTKSAIISLASGAEYKLGYHWLREFAPFVEKAVPKRPESVHIVDQYLDVARFLGAEVSRVEFPFEVPEADIISASKLLDEGGIESGMKFAVINPAAGHPLKEWGSINYARLIDKLWSDYKLKSALVTADTNAANAVLANINVPFANLAGKTSLKQLGAVLKLSTVQVCGDTGSAHMSAALGRPVVSLIGPTDPNRACPYNQRENVISGRSRCGNNCNWHHCEYSTPKCMGGIEVDEVLQKAAGLI